jgi:hypothetical protein
MRSSAAPVGSFVFLSISIILLFPASESIDGHWYRVFFLLSVASPYSNENFQTFYFIGRYSLLAALIGMWVL